MVERFAFYERAKKAFAVVATGFVVFYPQICVCMSSNSFYVFINVGRQLYMVTSF